jgi:probable HAF family extracellular repeat protein
MSRYHVAAGREVRDLGVPSYLQDSYAFSIDNAGFVVGYGDGYFGKPGAFRYEYGRFVNLGWDRVAYGINGYGTIVGDRETKTTTAVYFAAHDTLTSMGSLSTNPDAVSDAVAVNNKGEATGDSWTNQTYRPSLFIVHPFLYTNHHMQDLGLPPGSGQDSGNATGLNDLGDVVGYYYDPTRQGTYAAFLYHNGRMINLNTLLPPNSGWNLLEAYAINNNRMIVGFGTHYGQNRAFVLTFQP